MTVMVDFLTVRCPDPFGVPITGGQTMKVSPDGELEWVNDCRASVKGSFDTQITVRNRMASELSDSGIQGIYRHSGLEISGNPAKFLNGHNLFGSADVRGLLCASIDKVADVLGIERHHDEVGEAEISRVDLTGCWLVDRPQEVVPFLNAVRDYARFPYKRDAYSPSGEVGTLYFGYAKKGQRAKDWQLKLYWKGPELAKRPLPPQAMAVPGLLDEVNRTIRVELTLRTRELKKLGLHKVGAWTEETAERVWNDYVGRMDLGECDMTVDSLDLAGTCKPRVLDALASWKAGNDLKVGRSSSAYYRLVKEVRDQTGYDIRGPVPRSNIIPLRRVIEARSAGLPTWASSLERVMREAA